MRDVERKGEGWTKQKVEANLIAAFRVMPSIPVFASGKRFLAVGAEDRDDVTIVLGWASILDRDIGARKYLWAWARCRANGTSFGALCVGMGWPRTTAETARRRGAAAIAQALNERDDRA